jgi:hypothetical protein
MTFFDILSDILLKKSGGTLCDHPEFKKVFSSYMLCRYLSMRDSLLKYAELLNRYQTQIDAEQMYRLAYNIVPKQKSGFIKYIKKIKPKKQKDSDEETED